MTLVGDVLPGLLFTVTDNTTGEPAAPGSFTVTLTAPDGTTPSITCDNPTTGVFTNTTFVATQAGRWTARGVAAGNNTDGVQVISWDVRSGLDLLIDVPDVLAQPWAAGMPTDTGTLEQVTALCLEATDAVARDLDRAVVRETVTEKHSGGGTSIRLRRTPVVQVTSVTESGTALSTEDGIDWVLDDTPSTGLLYRGSATSPGRWSWGRANISVTYTADLTPKPPVLRSVALGIVEQLWQAAGQVPRGSFDQATVDAAVYATVATLTGPERAAYNSLRAAGIA